MEKRLLKESKQKIQNELILKLEPFQDSLNKWCAVILGPKDSPYQNYKYTLDIEISEQYPISPPKIKFKTPIYHPNINFETGEICLDILKLETWVPTFTLAKILEAIQLLLKYPEPNSPLNVDAAILFRLKDELAIESIISYYAKIYLID